VYLLLDEFIIAGEVQETSVRSMLESLQAADEWEKAEVLQELIVNQF
jgi:hypothetical protein